MHTTDRAENSTVKAALRLVGYGLVGIFVFFVPVPFRGTVTIPLDHAVSFVREEFPGVAALFALLVIVAGTARPFATGDWKRSKTDRVLSVLGGLGVVAGAMAYFSVGPDLLLDEEMLPFLFDKLVIPVGLIVPIGALFLSFLVSYGLLELVGVLVEPVMRPLWRTPGRAAIDAVASFVGSYSIGLLITNRVYNEGKYSAREASIIATGFSTVSATFMVIVAKTLGLMELWLSFFWSALLVTFAITAVTVRLPPLSGMSTEGEEREPERERPDRGSRLVRAIREALQTAARAESLGANLLRISREGLTMAMAILPAIMSVGLLGLLAAKHTPLFDLFGYAFYPFAEAARIPDALAVSKAAASGLAEMFLPPLLMTEAAFVPRFVTGIVSISSILFFSASIPCILATDIPITIPEMVVIWLERVALGLLLSAPLAWLLAPTG